MKLVPPRGHPPIARLFLAFGVTCAFSLSQQVCRAEEPREDFVKNIANLEIEDLLKQEITSVAKRKQSISEAPAAIFVITQEDLRRSGVRSIPEALRMVPGLEVTRIDSHQWAITARGFNGAFANKLLVLMDGRSVYTPLFSGVYWDAQDTFLDDIDRIEVIRGPGATLWGANAVNGVINIITRDSSQTRGTVIDAGGGSREALAAARLGVPLGDTMNFRTYVKGTHLDGTELHGSDDGNHDSWRTLRGGFRMDSTGPSDNSFTFQGDVYGAHESQEIIHPVPTLIGNEIVQDNPRFSGYNLISRWSRKNADLSESTFQAYLDHTHREDEQLDQSLTTYDFDLQHSMVPWEGNRVTAGLGYRLAKDDDDPHLTSISPDRRDYDVYSAFAQDEQDFLDNKLRLTFGSKFEENNFNGFEVQPSVRALALLTKETSLWSAISRAVRTSSRAETGIGLDFSSSVAPNGLPVLGKVIGQTDLNAEEMIAYEAGLRQQLAAAVSIDLCAYYNQYNNLIAGRPGTPMLEDPLTNPHLLLPIFIDDVVHGRTYGTELVTTVDLTEWWKLQASYTYFDSHFALDAGVANAVRNAEERDSLHNQATLRMLLNLSDSWQADAFLRYLDQIQFLNVDPYVELNLRLGWRLTDRLDLSVVGENLLHPDHLENIAGPVMARPADIPRSVFGQLRYKF